MFQQIFKLFQLKQYSLLIVAVSDVLIIYDGIVPDSCC